MSGTAANGKKRGGRRRRELIWAYRLRITLLDVQPLIWRVVLVPETITLPKLHAVIQTAMGWTNSHLHEFLIGDRRYSDYPDEFEPQSVIDERRVVLEHALGRAARTFDYVYDFGDGWHHAVVLEEREPMPLETAMIAQCLAAERACPPEDVGGASGYADFLEVIADPRHPEHRHLLAWSGGDFDPERFDLDAVNAALKRIKI